MLTLEVIWWASNYYNEIVSFWVTEILIYFAELSGFVRAFQSAAPGLTPKHTTYAFITYSQICGIFVLAMWEKNKNKQKDKKRPGLGIFKKQSN